MKILFQIGFNKCGTMSLHNFFLNNDIKSIHWAGAKLANKIYENKKNGVSLLSGYEEYQAFVDMEDADKQQYVAIDLFKDLYRQYPDAIFIFNDRNVEKWIQSRLKHGLYAKRCMEAIGLNSIDEVKEYWRKQYIDHKHNVLEFFGDKLNFIYFKIDEKNSNDKLIEGLLKNKVDIKNKFFPHAQKTSDKINKQLPDKDASSLRDAVLNFVKKRFG